MARSSRPAARATIASIDSKTLKTAALRVAAKLASEAENQNGYVVIFPDGRVSVELEWIDPEEIAKAAIEAYLETAPLVGEELRKSDRE
jgi:hypothetical protein